MTIKTYRDSLDFYARFLQCPLEELHETMSVDNLMEYLDSPRVKGMKPNSRRIAVAAISRYMKTNGIEFDELEMSVVRARKVVEPNDKTPTVELWQKMMDLADVRMKAWIIFLISTGCRGGESAKIRTTDIRGDAVTIQNEYAKGGRGGIVYLTAEAREYLDLWLKERDRYIELAGKRAANIRKGRPGKDDRLFASTYSSLSQRFAAIYAQVDGETAPIQRGERGLITPHSCRRYFRTAAAQGGLHVDIVERLMRHEGYLTGSYLRLPDTTIREEFHAHEDALYITRADRRFADGKVIALQDKISRLEARLDLLDKVKKASKENEGG